MLDDGEESRDDARLSCRFVEGGFGSHVVTRINVETVLRSLKVDSLIG